VQANGIGSCERWSEAGASCRPCDILDDDPECYLLPENLTGPGMYSCKNETVYPDGANFLTFPIRSTCSAPDEPRSSADPHSSSRCIETCCPDDPNCKAWTDKMHDKHWPILAFCPTVYEGEFIYSTFSCYADHAWMQLTGTVALIYLVILLLRTFCLPKSKKMMKGAIPVVSHAVGMPKEEEEEAAIMDPQ